MKKIVAVTACPTGIAHTYMAADCLHKAAQKMGVHIRVETQGAMGVENPLTPQNITQANLVLIVSDIEIEQISRFHGCKMFKVSIESVLMDAESIINRCFATC